MANRLRSLFVMWYLYTSYRRGLAEVAYPLWKAMLEPECRDKRKRFLRLFCIISKPIIHSWILGICQHKVNHIYYAYRRSYQKRTGETRQNRGVVCRTIIVQQDKYLQDIQQVLHRYWSSAPDIHCITAKFLQILFRQGGRTHTYLSPISFHVNLSGTLFFITFLQMG